MKKALTPILLLLTSIGFAQKSGGLASGLAAATAELQGIMDPLGTFLYIIAGITALYGAVRIYSKFQNGDQDTSKAIAQYGFGFVFLLASGYMVKAFFV